MNIDKKWLFYVIAILSNSLSLSFADQFQIYYDQDSPQQAFCVGDIELALTNKKHQVVRKKIADFSEKSAIRKIVITTQKNEKILKNLDEEIPELKAQAYALRTTNKGSKNYWVVGGDDNGAMYGGLQLAEYLTFQGVVANFSELDSPFLKNRGIKFNIPLDEDSPTYFYSSGGTSHKLAIKDVWEMQFWKTWFDEMARHRYNVLSLWSPHPFTSMVNMEDEYPGIAINGVTGFDEKGKEVKVNDWPIDKKIEFWREVMKYGKDRGFDTYICNWNLFLSTAEDKHDLTDSTENPKTKVYLAKCVTKLFETYPYLKGFGITVGEKMGSLDHVEKEEWAWDSYGRPIMEFAEKNPNREIVFIHRQHDGDIDHILKFFAPLNKLPNVRMDLSCKYSEAHAHSTTTPSRWHRTNMEDGLSKHGIKSWLTVRNDDFYYLHWAEPQFVRDYISGFPEVDKYVVAFYIGADGWVFAKDFTSKDPYYREKDALSIERTWLMQKLWGRISYNPKISDEFFEKHLAAKFPKIDSSKLLKAWSNASGSIRRANEQVTGKWQFDADYWIEMWTGDTWKGKGRHFSNKDTMDATPFAGSHLASLRDTAEEDLDGKTSAWNNIKEIDSMSQEALKILSTIDAGNDVELNLTLKDLTAQAHLGQYNAHKFTAVIHELKGEKELAKDSMAKAYLAWKNYASLMTILYKPTDQQRNKSFSSWHENDDVILADYHRLGGEGIPNGK